MYRHIRKLLGITLAALPAVALAQESTPAMVAAAEKEGKVTWYSSVDVKVAEGIKKAKSTDTDKVIAAMAGQTFPAPGGFTSTMDAKNHHLHKPVFIGEVKADGQFSVVWKTNGPVKAQPWSPFIPGNDKKKDEPELMTTAAKKS